MSFDQYQRKKKAKHQRYNHRNYHLKNRMKKRKKILRNSGWKLKFPNIFILIDLFPYIVRKEAKK